MSIAIENEVLSTLGIGQSASAEQPRDRLGQAEFLKLMVAQLKNQDPFKPMESGEFLGDIAQFGTVSGIQELQQAFAGLSGSIQSNQALQAAALVGRDVLVPTARGWLASGGSVRGAVDLPASTTQLAVNVFNAGGELVRRIDMGTQAAGLAQFQWDGLRDDGSYAAPGLYTVRAEAILGGETAAVDALLVAPVESVTLGGPGEGLTVNLGALGAVEFAQVRQIM